MDLRLLRLRPAGMFSNVNEVVQHIYLAEKGGYRFAIKWESSCYKTDDRSDDPWAYYFQPIWTDADVIDDSLEVLPTGRSVACTVDNIITPRKKDGDCNPLLLPKDRHFANAIIDRFISLNEDTAEAVNSFISGHLTEPYIGLHIRGPGRLDGGAAELRQKYGEPGNVPFHVYFEEVDRALARMPDAKILACSDSSIVIDRVRDTYGDRVVTHGSTLSEFGEMHTKRDENQGLEFNKHKLGLDVLVEAYALANSEYFIHGNSNVANFVLCKSPDLKHRYLSI